MTPNAVTPSSELTTRPGVSLRYRRRKPLVDPSASDAQSAPAQAVMDVSALGSEILAYLCRLGVPTHDAEELTQDVLLTAHARRDTFRGESSLRTWLRGIALRVTLNWRRRNRTRATYEQQLSTDGDVDALMTPCTRSAFDHLHAKELCIQVNSALASEPPIAQRLWRLVVLDELSIVEASQCVDLTESQGYELFVELRGRARVALQRAERVGHRSTR